MIPLKDENPTRTFPFITISLIVINILVFLYELSLNQESLRQIIHHFGIIPYHLTHLSYAIEPSGIPRFLTLITSTFFHGGVFHLASNMLFFWIFGNNIEDVLGHINFIFLYFISAIVAGLSQALVIPQSFTPVIGASGAVAGILGAYLILYPRARILTLFWLLFFVRIIRIPAVIFLGFWFFLQIINAGLGGGVAWFAHIGGFIAGMIMIITNMRKRSKILIHGN